MTASDQDYVLIEYAIGFGFASATICFCVTIMFVEGILDRIFGKTKEDK